MNVQISPVMLIATYGIGAFLWQVIAQWVGLGDSWWMWIGGAVILVILSIGFAIKTNARALVVIVALFVGTAAAVLFEAILAEAFFEQSRNLFPLGILLWWVCCCLPAAILFGASRFMRRLGT